MIHNRNARAGRTRQGLLKGLWVMLLLSFLVGHPAWAADDDSGTSMLTPASAATGPGNQWDFQTDLFTGRFTTKVPIMVAPGRGAVTPTLVLGYNSAGGNGWCGVGWTLDTAFIQRSMRDGTPVRRDSNGDPESSYNETCPFTTSFGGVETRLFFIGDTAGVSNYAAEVERNFTQFTYANGAWTAVDKAGTKYFFGRDSASRMTTQYGTFRWALDKVVDINGNVALFSYTSDGGQLYPYRIDYNGNESASFPSTHQVEFFLENRPDTNINCRTGSCITQAKRLQRIEVRAGGSFVRQYTLIYSNSLSTYRSLLSEVRVSGSDPNTNLPPLKFQYQQLAFRFGNLQAWGTLDTPDVGPGNENWHSIQKGNNLIYLQFADINGDGLPDRVMSREEKLRDVYPVQLNTNGGFSSLTNWAPLLPSGIGVRGTEKGGQCKLEPQTLDNATNAWGEAISASGKDGNNPYHTYLALLDINGDGLPDRVMRPPKISFPQGATCFELPYTNLNVQLNDGKGFDIVRSWAPTTNSSGNMGMDWSSISRSRSRVSLATLDINGDGLVDRVMWAGSEHSTAYKVQVNTGKGFTPTLSNWGSLNNSDEWCEKYDRVAVTKGDNNPSTALRLMDINGDGLPDRIMVKQSQQIPASTIAVQLNNGVGFEPQSLWGPVLNDTGADNDQPARVISYNDGTKTMVELMDINGDGLPDRIMVPRIPKGTEVDPATLPKIFVVQLNTGAGFGPVVHWENINTQDKDGSGWRMIRASDGEGNAVIVDLFDINGDGLPDRVMRKAKSSYTEMIVQPNEGNFPDLMSRIDNGLGGSAQISYLPSTKYDNLGTNGVSQLPFPVYTVSSVTVSDGRGNNSTTTYSYKGGYYDWMTPEFRGFNRVEVTDPLGTRTITYFHQGLQSTHPNARTPDNFFFDEEAKKGIPYRVELWGANGAGKYSQTINVVEVAYTHTNALIKCAFTFIKRTVQYSYETLATPRMTATEFTYNTDNGNLLKVSNLGEVTAHPDTGQILTQISDPVYTHTSYKSFASIGPPYEDVVNHPSAIWTSASSDPGYPDVLRGTLFEYYDDTKLHKTLRWIDWDGGIYATNTITSYDSYGNPLSVTGPDGIASATEYEPTYHLFPLKQITGNFTNTVITDVRTGQATIMTDAKDLKAETIYDVFYRPQETRLYTNAAGTLYIWRKRFAYQTDGITAGGISQNRVTVWVNDGIAANGEENLQTITYYDGLSRALQTRVKAEQSGNRVSYTEYDARGNPRFQSVPYFATGDQYELPPAKDGSTTEYDPIGRVSKVTPPGQGGDPGSPTGPSEIFYSYAGDPWATVTKDSEGKVRRSFQDGFGRVVRVTEVNAGADLNTYYTYDLLGNLTYVKDSAGNITYMLYDSLGRKRWMQDPDMGTWQYAYDRAGRMIGQWDPKTNVVIFAYDDPLGRLTTKKIYNATEQAATITYEYDTGTSGHPVFKGQLAKVTDRQGWERYGYDIRGRVLRSTRHLNVNSQEYVIKNEYDELDRPKLLTYPSNLAKIEYSYDVVGHLSQVQSTCGTGAQETFYTPQGFNEFDQITGINYGNGVQTTFEYYNKSRRLRKTRTTKAGQPDHQNLTYGYDTVSNIKSITDAAHAPGSASASLENVQYDDLYRLKSYTRNTATYSFDYNSIGNILSGTEFGGGSYTYGSSRPHAVTSANGNTYLYDGAGNMTNRHGQALFYDEENQLTKVVSDSATITFGYADGGARLWQQVVTNGTTKTTVWIGGIYEEKAGKTLCHVFAGGQRVATFEPVSPYCAFIQQHKLLAVSGQLSAKALNWPFQEGRTPLTATLIPLLGVLCASMAGRRRSRRAVILSLSKDLRSFGFGAATEKQFHRLHLHSYPRWLQAISVLLIVALFLAVTPTTVQAVTFDPVFYYYHGDHLGSTSVLTDRAGEKVQEYGYAAFGKERFKENTQAFAVSHLYTGQIFDDDTGLYYYNARYYDPEIGRFTQPDTIVQEPTAPQTLNRYSYVVNNPLNYTDPSGNVLDPITIGIIVGAIVGAAVGAASAAINNQNIFRGAAFGAIAGAVGGAVGGAVWGPAMHSLSSLGASQAFARAAAGVAAASLGGAAAGATGAALYRGNVGLGALAGFAGGLAGGFVSALTVPALGAAVGGGVAAEIQGGDFWEGAAYGAGGSVAGAIAEDVIPTGERLDENAVKTLKPGTELGFKSTGLLKPLFYLLGEAYSHVVTYEGDGKFLEARKGYTSGEFNMYKDPVRPELGYSDQFNQIRGRQFIKSGFTVNLDPKRLAGFQGRTYFFPNIGGARVCTTYGCSITGGQLFGYGPGQLIYNTAGYHPGAGIFKYDY